MKRIILVFLAIITLFSVFIMPKKIMAENNDEEPVEIILESSEEDNESQEDQENDKNNLTIEYETKQVEIYFYCSGREWTYGFPYSDDWFKEADDHYNHQLCRGSFGLTVAAFRLMNLELGKQDESLIQYYKDTGFSNIETYNYENLPTDNSISNGIASKKIDDFTLIAVGVCGSGYKDEWCSNLTVGTSVKHEGFNSAALQVENRIEEYIEKYHITGKIKIWLTGFSRASAVSNLVAADLTDSGKFEDVYGYHFAVPNNTTKSKKYNNIYCIVGKNDPVPFVSLEEWGYTKNGMILYTPSIETDFDFSQRYVKATKIYKEITGEEMSVSPEINKSIRLILMNLLDMIPERDVYVSDLQQAVITAWHAKSNTSDLMVFLAGVVSELGKAQQSIQDKANALGEYILNLGVEFSTKNPDSVFADDYYEGFNLASNLVREHQPITYIAWLFSCEDPSEIFTENLDFTRLYIYGDVIVSIYDDEGLIETIDVEGNVSGESADDLSKDYFLYTYMEDERLEIVIPKDQNYLIQMQGTNGDFSYEGVTYTGRRLQGKQIERTTISIEEKSNYYILSRASNGEESVFSFNEDFELIESSTYASPSILLAMENSNIFHLTFEHMKTLATINIALLAFFILSVIVRLFRVIVLKKKAGRLGMFSMNLSISFIFILLYEQADIYLDSVPVVRTVLGILTMLSVLHLCYSTMKPISRRLSRFFLVAILFGALGNYAKQYLSIDAGTVLYMFSCIIITTGVVIERKPKKELFRLSIIVSIIISMGLCLYTRKFPLFLILYVFSITLMNITAGNLDKRLRILIGAFMLPGCLSVWESYTGGNVKIHTFLVLAYSIGLLIIIAFILYKSYKLEKRYESKKVMSSS